MLKINKRMLGFIAFTLSLIISFPASVTYNRISVYATEEQYGDIDESGKPDAKDALMVLKSAAKLLTLTDNQKRLADVNADENVDAKDALDILMYAAKKIDKFVAEENVKNTPIPSEAASELPTEEPTAEPTAEPTTEPTAAPTVEPTAVPTVEPTAAPTAEPTAAPTVEPTAVPTVEPTAVPTAEPTAAPTVEPTAAPTVEPTVEPTVIPTPPVEKLATNVAVIVEPAASAAPTETTPITYEAENKLFTFHGQNPWPEAADITTIGLSNAEIEIANPFAGLDLKERLTKDDQGYPLWTKGVTISYWALLPEDATDSAILTFKLENKRTAHKDDLVKQGYCKNYRAADPDYKMGTAITYIGLDDQKEYTVLIGNGEKVFYNPEYPKDGCYKLDTEGTIMAYKKGTDPEIAANIASISYLGAGYYENYIKRFEEEGGENSKIREADVSGSLTLYASGCWGFIQDDKTSLQLNPNGSGYNTPVAMTSNKCTISANGAYQRWILPKQLNPTGKIPPILSQKGLWHFVVITIKNDAVQYYMDGIELGPNYQNYNGNSHIARQLLNVAKEFNLGYGPAIGYQTSSPSVNNSKGMLLTTFISDSTTRLFVGGAGAGIMETGYSNIGTPDGVQVKDIRFYDSLVTPDKVAESTIYE